MAKSSADTLERYYYGSMVYGMSFVGAYVLGYALHEEGQAQANGTYQYNLKDHLGNTRAMYSKSAGAGQAATLVQSTNYYPFGKSFEKVTKTNRNRYLYNGKELQDQVIGGTAFGWYDYGARFYDPELGRFTTQDRFSKKYYELSN